MHFQQAVPHDMLAGVSLQAAPCTRHVGDRPRLPGVILATALLSLPIVQFMGESYGLSPSTSTGASLIVVVVGFMISTKIDEH
ncbi:hypothetical protein F5Y08DRAFT_309011 [Xylaria arbuscula]|nr:hypothetical protein F5Y08DRAFT_309011 [Xylaria arbuscula]